ncbi:centriole protein, partial [Haematococcus lacustris]
FQAVLSIRGSESLFKIVETNDFKQLPHITLAFRPGNDAAVKQFLAFRLLEVKGNAEDLTTQLARMTVRQLVLQQSVTQPAPSWAAHSSSWWRYKSSTTSTC